MDKYPFSLYDFFSYLSAGAIWLISIDLIFNTGWLVAKQPNIVEVIFFVVIAYVIGHINSHLASGLFEKWLVAALGYPSLNLFIPRQKYNRFFKSFQKPLPEEFAKQIILKYKEDTGKEQPGESMFLHCYHIVKETCPQTYARLETFLSLYGFSRNISFALLFVGLIAMTTSFYTCHLLLTISGVIAIFGSYIMLLRYLKFFRHFAIEVFSTYGTSNKMSQKI